MNLDELRSLDPRDPGRWPLAVRASVIALCFLVLSLVGLYMLVWTGQRETLQQFEREELSLREQFREKHIKAVNLDLYKQQLADIERSFGAMLRQLPGKTEMPNLLVDISQTGLAAGLKQELFQRMPEQNQDFYAEQPIKIRLTGSFHQMGDFVSGIAALPRIVTLHDVEVKALPQAAYDQLQLDVTARTYRYLDEDELAAAEAERRKAQQGQRGSSAGG
jgi:type IV pilus assembly protein PilO